MLRILANYVQLIGVALSFNIKYPKSINQLMVPFELIGSATKTFLSFDWFMKTTDIKGFAPSSKIFKVFLIQILPLILITIISLIFVFLRFTWIKKFRNLKLCIAVTIVWVVFLLHPTIVKSTFSLFECQRIEDDVYKMKAYSGFDCYSTEHITWIMLLAVPSLILWVIGIPLLAFIVLLLNRNNLDSGPVRIIFLVLYQGFKQKAFYWEFVNTLRKVLLLLFSTVLSVYSLYYSTFISISISIVLVYIQIKIDPYEDKRYNQIEIKAVIAGTMALFCGIIFTQKSNEDGTPAIIMAIIIILFITNLMFIIEWLYLFVKTFKFKNAMIQLLLQILASLILVKHEFEEVNESESSKSTEQNEKISIEASARLDLNNVRQSQVHSNLNDKLSQNSMILLSLLQKLFLT